MSEVARALDARPLRRFRPYPAYKNSGFEWLGKIPADWAAKRLKNCVQRLESGGTPESDNYEYWTDDDSGVPWVAISDMTRSFHVRDTAKRLTERGLRSKRLPVLPPGTLLYSMYASLGKVALLEIDAVVNQAILGLVTRDELVSRDFLRWWLEFMQGHVQLLSSSNTQDNLNADKVRKMPVFVPGSVEQRAIAAFLDRETARIDALVAKKERLIALLQEQRTALITRAVTKGLDPTVPMKDSGVEWLGEIPAHWEVKPLKRVFANLDSMRVPLSGEDRATMTKEYPYYGASGVIDHVEDYLFDEPLILVAEDGANLYSRSTPLAFVAAGRYWVNNHAHILKPLDGDVSYWAQVLSSVVFDPWISGSAQPKLTGEKLGSIPLAVLPVSERRAIATFLGRETARIDALIAKVRDAIDRLKELRTALISAAVTGKIDVREEVA